VIRLAVVVAALAAGCTRLPDPESPGAQAYARRCGECHRAYAPGSMTWPMWQFQLGRMHGVLARAGRPWLTADEEGLVTEYLRSHAGSQ
jgi:hypothetical protein